MRGVLTVLSLFDRVGIPAIVLKGAPLLWFYYQDFGQRMMNDVDVLIAGDDLARAAVALQEAGWQFTNPLPDLDFLPFLLYWRRQGPDAVTFPARSHLAWAKWSMATRR